MLWTKLKWGWRARQLLHHIIQLYFRWRSLVMVVVRRWQWLETSCGILMPWWRLVRRRLCLLPSKTLARPSVRRSSGECIRTYCGCVLDYYMYTILWYIIVWQSWGGWSNSSGTCSLSIHLNSFKGSWIKGMSCMHYVCACTMHVLVPLICTMHVLLILIIWKEPNIIIILLSPLIVYVCAGHHLHRWTS